MGMGSRGVEIKFFRGKEIKELRDKYFVWIVFVDIKVILYDGRKWGGKRLWVSCLVFNGWLGLMGGLVGDDSDKEGERVVELVVWDFEE